MTHFTDGHSADCGYHVDQYPWECTCHLAVDRLSRGRAAVGFAFLAIGLMLFVGYVMAGA